MPKASEVAAELRRAYSSNQSRLEAVHKIKPSPVLAPLYVEIVNFLHENNFALRLAIDALEAPASAQVGVAFGGPGSATREEAQIGGAA